MNLEKIRLEVKLQKIRDEYRVATESWQKSFLKLQGNSVKLALLKLQRTILPISAKRYQKSGLQKNVSEIFGKK